MVVGSTSPSSKYSSDYSSKSIKWPPPAANFLLPPPPPCKYCSALTPPIVIGGRFNRLDVEALEFSLFAYIFLNQLLLIYTSLKYNLLETPSVPIEADTEAKTERWRELSVGLSPREARRAVRRPARSYYFHRFNHTLSNVHYLRTNKLHPPNMDI